MVWCFEVEIEVVMEVIFLKVEFNSFKVLVVLFKGQNGWIWFVDGGKLYFWEDEKLLFIDILGKIVDNFFELKSGKVLFILFECIFLLDFLGNGEYCRFSF